MKSEEITNSSENQVYQKPPTILDGLILPGFLPKVFTSFFLKDCLVFVKTGSVNTDTSSGIRAFLGGSTSDALIMGALGSIVDARNREKRINKAASVAGWNPEDMVAAHKRNFMLPYNNINKIEFKGPNFAGELKIIVDADKTYKFRVNNQSKQSALYYEKIFNEFLPGKTFKR